MAGEFSVARRHVGDRLILDVYGELDVAGVETLRESVSEAIASHPGPAVLDLGKLEMITSIGLQALVAATDAARAADFDLSLRPPTPAVMRIFEIAGLHERLFTSPGE